MGSRTTDRTSHRPIVWPAISAWMERIFKHIDIAATTRRHRLGAWEECASFRARALHRMTEKDTSAR